MSYFTSQTQDFDKAQNSIEHFLLCLEKITLVLEPFVNTGNVIVFRNIV